MVERQDKIIADLVPLFHNINKEESNTQNGDREEVLLFFSFDIVNSTIFKTLNPNNWAEIIKNILKASISIFINSSSDDYLMWKSLGDEIVFTKKLTSVAALDKSLDEIYNKLQALNQSIRNAELCDAESAHILGVKATAWLANLSGGNDTDNISVAYQINDNRKYLDYLGPDIDIGFRISKYSMENQLLISFEIAYLLLKIQEDRNIASRVRFVTRASLKGVWNNLPYPIFGYQYDVKSNTSRGMHVIAEAEEDVESYEERVVGEICAEMHLEHKIEKLLAIITRKSDITPRRIIRQYKVRYRMVCYQREEQDQSISFMMVKTEVDGAWKLVEIETYYDLRFAAFIQEYFMDKLRIDVQVELDSRYYGQVPVVVSSTDGQDEKGTSVKDMVLLGRMVSEMHTPHTAHYTEVVFINEKEIESETSPYTSETRYMLSGYLEYIRERWKN